MKDTATKRRGAKSKGTNLKQLTRTRACDGTGDQRSRFQPGSPEGLNDKAVKGMGKR